MDVARGGLDPDHGSLALAGRCRERRLDRRIGARVEIRLEADALPGRPRDLRIAVEQGRLDELDALALAQDPRARGERSQRDLAHQVDLCLAQCHVQVPPPSCPNAVLARDGAPQR